MEKEEPNLLVQQIRTGSNISCGDVTNAWEISGYLIELLQFGSSYVVRPVGE
jgi:hypothetical protein